MSHNQEIRVIGASQVASILAKHKAVIIGIVSEVYIAHYEKNTSLPHSVFLRYPEKPNDRIIGLPAYIKIGDKEVSGIKWVASFPENLSKKLPRASASLILNDSTTGRATCLLEASNINLYRTAASAALAAMYLCDGDQSSVALIGCGPVNAKILDMLRVVFSDLREVHIYDQNRDRAMAYASKLEGAGMHPIVHDNVQNALLSTRLVSFATTAARPHIHDRSAFSNNSVVLHVSLRDIAPRIIIDAVNVVDDAEHVNREQTSIHLASQMAGHTDFIGPTIGQIIKNKMKLNTREKLTIYSPFGLGILDVALADFILEQAIKHGIGTIVKDFL